MRVEPSQRRLKFRVCVTQSLVLVRFLGFRGFFFWLPCLERTVVAAFSSFLNFKALLFLSNVHMLLRKITSQANRQPSPFGNVFYGSGTRAAGRKCRSRAIQ